MKHFGSLLFLAIFLIGLLGPYAYFIVRLQQIHTEMRQELRSRPDEELELLRLTETEYRRARVGDDEIEVNDRMYDIARIKKAGGWVYVYCLHDEDEDNLITLIDRVLKNASKDKKQVPVSLPAFANMLHTASFCLPIPDDPLNPFNSRYLLSWKETHQRVLSPPPRGI